MQLPPPPYAREVQLPEAQEAGQLHAGALQSGFLEPNCTIRERLAGASIHACGRRDLTYPRGALRSILLLFPFPEPFGPAEHLIARHSRALK